MEANPTAETLRFIKKNRRWTYSKKKGKIMSLNV